MKKFLITSLLLISLKIPTVDIIHDDNFIDVPAVELESAKSAVLMEVDTGEVIFEYNCHEKRAPASMTKIMTMKLVMDAIKDNKFTMDEYLTTSDYAASMGGSQIFLSPGEQMSVNDLFKSMVIASANDAAVVFAEKISGSEDNFAKLMNHTAIKLGCKNTSFKNATGLPTEEHLTTSYDMALIACNLLKEYEEDIIPYTSLYEDYIRKDTENPFWLVNTNKLIKSVDFVDGLKTGWTEEAGYCITTTMKKGNMRLVCVVMGAESPTLRNKDTMRILNYGFNSYKKDIIYEKGTIIEEGFDIKLIPSTYQIAISDDIVNVYYKNERSPEIKFEIEIYHDKIRTLEKTKIGIIKTYANNNLISVTDLELVEVTKKATFIDLFISIFKSLF